MKNIELSKKDSINFIKTLLDPPKPNDALKNAANIHKKLIRDEKRN